jgi:serine/threonine protein kinase
VLGTGTDARSDVYALGATMYALLTGAPPPPAHERMTGSQLVPPRTVHPAIPADLERLILWCLELRPENRPQSVEQVRAALASGGWGMEAAQTEAVTNDVSWRGTSALRTRCHELVRTARRAVRREVRRGTQGGLDAPGRRSGA